MVVKIYSLDIQHNYLAIKAACKMSGMEYEFVSTNILEGEQMKPEYLAKFPMHCIPAMEDTDNGLCVTETNAILRYICRKTQSKLYPTDPKLACLCDFMLDHKLSSLAAPIAKMYIYPAYGFPELSAEEVKENMEKLKKDLWPAVTKCITESKGPFVCGSQVTIADLSLWGHVKLIDLMHGKKGCEFLEIPGVKEWYAAVEGTIGEDWFSDANYGMYKAKAA